MSRISALLLLLTCSMIISTPTSFADGVSVDEVSGNTIIPVQQNSIRMVSETVWVKNERVTATFTFENMTEKHVGIKMGFPFRNGADPMDTRTFQYMDANNLHFIVKVNKSDVPVTKMAVAETYKQDTGEHYDFMYTWPIVFQPKEKQVVECSYNVQWGDDLGMYGGFTYIAKTGALWKSTLDYADFYIELDKHVYDKFKSSRFDFKISPTGYKLNGETVEWHFTNWKPTVDFTISYEQKLQNEDPEVVQRMIGLFEFKKKYEGDKKYYTIEDLKENNAPQDEFYGRFYIKLLWNEIFARHGRTFKSENLQQAFANQRWYKPNPSFSESMLNKYEKANVDFILRYEKKRGWQ